MTGWIEALKTPSAASSATTAESRGKILRLKGSHLTEKVFVLKTVLHQIWQRENFPVLFPSKESRDFLSQLLARSGARRGEAGARPMEPAWEECCSTAAAATTRATRAGEDVVGALSAATTSRPSSGSWRNGGSLPSLSFSTAPLRDRGQERPRRKTLRDLVAREG